jgi:hypothetical protein
MGRMSSQTPMPATGATPLDEPVRQGLADPEVARRLMLLVRAAPGRFPAGVTAAQRAGEASAILSSSGVSGMPSRVFNCGQWYKPLPRR